MAARGIKKIFATGLTEVKPSTELVDDLGDIRFENGKIYKYVNYAQSTIAATAGSVVVYKGSNGYASNIVTGDYSEGASANRIAAGVVVGAISTSENSYVWVQIKGPATLSVTLGGTATDGSPLTVVGASDKAMDLIQVTAATETVFAHAEDASAQIVVCDFPF